MTRQFIRKVTLLVGKDSGDALDLSKLRIKFSIKKTDAETPNVAEIQVFNLEGDTSQRIQKEFTDIILQAGYEDNFGVIFRGNAKQVLRGREPNGVDSYLNIAASDGDAAYNFAVVNATLAAGARQSDQVNAALGPMGKMGVKAGYAPDLGRQALPRGKVMYGNSREYLRQTATNSDTAWSIQDGKVQFVPRTGLLPGQAVVLTSASGLIGTPEQTNDGIKIKCLINPQIKPGGVVAIRDSEIKAAKATKFFKVQDAANDADRQPVKIDPDGLYKVLRCDYTGDTHGDEWYQELICVGIDDTAPVKKKVKGT
jgi:hypothetical protein